MAENQNEELYPGKVRVWRIGFVVLSAVIFGIFINVAVLLEITRQIALVIDWSFANPFWFAAWILLLIQGYLIGAWLSIQVIFGSTHPVHKPHYWRWVFTSFILIGIFTMNVFYVAQLQLYTYRPPSWLYLLNLDLIFNSFINCVMAFMIGGDSLVMWFKWLKPLDKSK